ncbi:amino acid adenylation domain-containing protein [Pseudoalteromonas sp. SMS1]|uniref:non-ribosomal peptide synthetase n=1 Tax=Pseudoalteromonas sp. SMS1 TaxID=2908894 RepID=UPI001F3DC36E|nr:non-ribosomal peptide synthetase [Pseudoalteromonas sp. SMS1]MCF2857714.1 amino acid adenylation domain-containing protein [Pseudoalteromonas sp. SMS1]
MAQTKNTPLNKEQLLEHVQAFVQTPLKDKLDANLIELGLDSMHMMRLVNQWRKQGAKVTFSKLIEQPILSHWMTLLCTKTDAVTEVIPAPALPNIDPYAEFELTDVQYAYWIGRQDEQELGGVGCHAYIEVDNQDIDPLKLEQAWHALYQHHPMLRAQFTESGTQQVHAPLPTPGLAINDFRSLTRDEATQAVEQVRRRLSHRKLGIEHGQTMGLELSLLPAGNCRIHFDVDLLIADVQSLNILLKDLAVLYHGGTLETDPNWSFAKYLAYEKTQNKTKLEEDKAYWQTRLATLPSGPQLPLRCDPQTVAKPTFSRRLHTLTQTQWQTLKSTAQQHQVTPAMLLVTGYAYVLAKYSAEQKFTLNLPLFDRKTQHPGIEHAVADFTNLLLLDCDFSDAKGFIDHAKAIQNQFHQNVAHSDYSAVQIQRDLVKQGFAQGVSAPVVFACNLGTPLLSQQDTVLGQFNYMISQTPQVWLDHQVYEVDEGLMLAWDAVDEIFPEALIDTMFASYVALLEKLAAHSDAWQAQHLIELPHYQQTQRAAVNDTAAPYTPHTLHEAIFRAARTHPDKTALVFNNQSLSYRSVAEKALRVAAYLQQQGLRESEPVAVTLPRGAEQIIAVLGVLAAGGCYVPIGTHQPQSRRAKIHRTAEIKLVIAAHDDSEHDPAATFIDIQQALQAEPLASAAIASPESPAYIIFTSGSTGEPKGVEMSHQATANTIYQLNKDYQIGQDSCALAVSALDFDLSVYDIFGLLSVGGQLVLVDEQQRRDAQAWLDLVHQNNVTVWNTVPVLLDMLLTAAEQDCRPLNFEQVMLSGDWIGLDLPPRLQHISATNPPIIAMGGATEAAIWSNSCEVRAPLPQHWHSIPYGKPLPNQKYRVVDGHGHDCPDWVPGELWIGGIGLATCYCGDPAQTTARFVEQDGERWYRTGDQGRYWPDGNLEFLGRIDHQVKVRGHRIELGEIDTALANIEGVQRAVTVTIGEPKSLASVVVLAPQSTLDSMAIQRQLHTLLPDYMVPNHIEFVPQMPLSANGKVDRKALTNQLAATQQQSTERLTAPQTDNEIRLAKIWQSLLGIEHIGQQSHFFELGGDSLIATQLIAKLKQQGLASPKPLRDLFSAPQLSAYAARLDSVASTPKLEVMPDLDNRFAPFPLTEVQRAYWMGQTPGLPLNCSTLYLLELEGENVDLQRMAKAWDQLVEHHEMLRAVITPDGQQQLLSHLPAMSIAQVSLNSETNNHSDAARDHLHQFWRKICHQAQQSHDQSESVTLPNHRICAVHYGDNKTRLGIIFDYLTLDGFSIKLLLDQLASLYNDPAYHLPEINVSFRDYVLQVQHDDAEYAAAQAYWREQIKALPPAPQLPLAQDPQSITKPEFVRREAQLDTDTWQALKHKARTYGITPSVLLLTAYSNVLRRWSEGDHTLNLTLFDRQDVHNDIHKVFGDFTTLAPIAFRANAGNSLLAQAQEAQLQIAQAIEHKAISSIWIQREQARHGTLTSAALPVVFTSTLGLGGGLFENSTGNFPQIVPGGLSQTPQVWLDHQLYEFDGALVLSWDAADALFPAGMIDDMFNSYVSALQALCHSSWEQTLSLPLPATQAHTRIAVNHTERPQSPRTLHHAIFAHAQQHPDDTALVFEHTVVNYAQLCEQALSIAALLQQHQLKLAEPVAVTLPRGINQIAAVLGVMAAGGCYVPIGIHQPANRQAKIHRTAGIRLVLTNREHLDVESIDSVTRLDIASASAPLCKPVEVSPDQPAYIIFTSGSTGEPKGVEMCHQATANTIDQLNQTYNIDKHSCVLAVSALDFDLSVYDIFGLLGAGAQVVLLSDENRRDASAWLQLVHQHNVNVWNSVPVLFDMLLVVAEQDDRQLPFNQVMLSGDWIGLDIPPRLQAKSKAGIPLIAMGGATEAAIWSNFCEVRGDIPAHWNSIPYGKPLPNQTYRVADAQGRDCPDWVAGELWIGGVGLASAYRGDDTLTAERFVHYEGKRWYRTGDRGRYWPDGNLEFLGRIDHQVKVRGHRIELGEIDTALGRIEGIARGVALTLGEPKMLVAALVMDENMVLDTDAVNTELALTLPDYMVPNHLLAVDVLPLSANGKVDRKQLAAQFDGQLSAVDVAVTPPQTDNEMQVAQLWADLLGVTEVGLESSFFALGGDSLLATQFLTQLAQQGLSTKQPLRTLFANPTLGAFAATLEAHQAVHSQQIVAKPEQQFEPFALTEVQSAYWLGQTPGFPLNCGTHYLLELDSLTLDIKKMMNAWQTLYARHDMLRAQVSDDNQQAVLQQSQEPKLDIDSSTYASLDQARGQINTWWQAQNSQHVHDAITIKVARYHAGETERTRLALMFNYMTLDGYSIMLLLREFAALYQRPDTELPPLSLTFRDYVTQVQDSQQVVEEAQAYWQARLATLPDAAALPLAQDPLHIEHSEFSRRSARLPTTKWQAIKQAARSHNVTPSILVLSAYAEVLSQYSGGHAHTLNLTLFDRQNVHPEVGSIVGDFTSLAPLAYYPDEQNSIAHQAKQLQNQLADVLEHRAVSSVWVQRERSRTMGRTAAALPIVFTSTLGMADDLLADSFNEDLPQFTDGGLSATPQVWLDHQMYEFRGELILSWDAVDALFPADLLDNMFARFLTLLDELAVSTDAPFSHALPKAQQVVRDRVNNTKVKQTPRTLHQAMFDYACQHPDAVALITDTQTVTYGQLADKALRIAHLLTQHALSLREPVAVSLPRGVEQVAAVFGIMAAGGCYVPIGVHQPTSRQAKIHRTAGIRWVLTDEAHISQDVEQGVTRLNVADAADLTPLATPLTVATDAPAYVIFTSGSTGEPKGVEMCHQATANTIDQLNQHYTIDSSSRVLAVSALDFDLSVYDLFGLLSVGGSVVLLNEENRRDATTWLELVHQHRVTIWNSVPVLLDMLLVVAENDTRSLPFENVMLSGDWIGLDLPPRLQAKTHSEIPLIAMGGATEAAIWSNSCEVRGDLPAHWASIPYGKPLPNQTYRVVDPFGRDCPDWVAGELWIGGVGLASAYRGDETLTAQRFVMANGKRWYRTGDLGRYWPDGNLEFLGRIDHQVKVRGHRIELGEIDAAMAQVEGLSRGVALTIGEPKKLVAAFVKAPHATLDAQAITAQLELQLPEYMVPSHLLELTALPLSANGKIDRKQLANEFIELELEQAEFEAPEGELEQQLAEIWQTLLKRAQISRHDDFFAIGGDSLSATQLIQTLQQQHIIPTSLSLTTLFSAPSIASLATVITHAWRELGGTTCDTDELFEEGTI